MLHPNPRIAYRRLMRLYGGMVIVVVFAHLGTLSPWLALAAFAGLALMISVAWPVHRELTREMDRKQPPV